MKTHFETLGVSPDLAAALAADGITEAFPIQSLALPDALAGRDVCGKAKTGSGKTLAFGLPLLERVSKASAGHPTGLVLVPTRELAKQVRGVLAPLGKVRSRRCRAVYGGVPADKQIRSLATGVDVVVGTPGRIIDLVAQGHMALDAVEVLVVDEADRMADMGFMPQVQKILYRITGPHQTMLFSATLDGEVGAMATAYTRNAASHEADLPTARERGDVEHRFVPVTPDTKVEKLVELLEAERGLALVFVRTKHGADRLVRKLDRHGVRAVSMHGDKTQAARERALASFESGKVSTLVATDVAARGLDLDEITHVINFDPPAEGKDYVHRVGRTGRAGRDGTGITLVLPEQQADVSRVAARLGHTEQFASEGMAIAPPRVVYSSRRRGSKWGPSRPRRKI